MGDHAQVRPVSSTVLQLGNPITELCTNTPPDEHPSPRLWLIDLQVPLYLSSRLSKLPALFSKEGTDLEETDLGLELLPPLEDEH